MTTISEIMALTMQLGFLSLSLLADGVAGSFQFTAPIDLDQSFGNRDSSPAAANATRILEVSSFFLID